MEGIISRIPRALFRVGAHIYCERLAAEKDTWPRVCLRAEWGVTTLVPPLFRDMISITGHVFPSWTKSKKYLKANGNIYIKDLDPELHVIPNFADYKLAGWHCSFNVKEGLFTILSVRNEPTIHIGRNYFSLPVVMAMCINGAPTLVCYVLTAEGAATLFLCSDLGELGISIKRINWTSPVLPHPRSRYYFTPNILLASYRQQHFEVNIAHIFGVRDKVKTENCTVTKTAEGWSFRTHADLLHFVLINADQFVRTAQYNNHTGDRGLLPFIEANYDKYTAKELKPIVGIHLTRDVANETLRLLTRDPPPISQC